MSSPETAGALHVYGVVAADARAPPDLQGRHGAPVRRVRVGAVALLVSRLDPSARLGRNDLLAHAHVLEQIAGHEAVLPMRFGVEARDEEDLRRRVHDAGAWASLLRRFAGLVQLSVEASHREEQALRELLRRDPSLRSLGRKLPADDSLRAQALKLKLGEAAAHGLEELAQEDARALLGAFGPLARAAAQRAKTGRLLSVSLLVDRSRRDELDAVVYRVGQARPWLELHYVGPEPPWAFVDPSEEGGGAWAS